LPWSWLVGFLVGLSGYLIYLVGPYGIWGGRRYINFLRSLPAATKYPVVLLLAAYATGYPFLLKWHFGARSIFSSNPRRFGRAAMGYNLFLGAGFGITVLLVWLRERRKPRQSADNNTPVSNVTEDAADRR
jgi:hypothetical protein